MSNLKSTRSSNIEFLRLIIMFYIVLYHFCSYIKSSIDPNNRFVLLGYTLFHIGVPVFILISGYFTIKLSTKKIVTYYLYCTLWYIFCYIFAIIINHNTINLKECLLQLFPFNNTQGRWFVTYYFWLMLLSPLLNQVSQLTLKKHIFLVLLSLTMIIYSGLVWNSDIINGGKSIIYFISLYMLGNLIKRINIGIIKTQIWIKLYIIIILFISILNFILPLYLLKPLRGLTFAYQSPILILSSILFFIIFLKLKINNPIINYLSMSSFAIYLLHENKYISPCYKSLVKNAYANFDGPMVFLILIFLSILFCVVAIIVDKTIRNPLQSILEPPLLKYLTQLNSMITNNITHLKNKYKL
ncbi:acyltransferase [Phocaeicola barnesiae]|uniref:acyltransferase n=1 Tax=Phocaeicola barnesiae TaxID=376804 RepID=UPI003364FB2D